MLADGEFVMKKFLALLALTSILLPGLASADTANEKKVLMYVAEGSRDPELMLGNEVGVMQTMLEDAGYTVDFATASGQPMAAATVTLEPTVMLGDVDIASYAGVILPCMAPGPDAPNTPAIVEALLEEAIALGKPVAASRGSVVTLARAGGVSGRDYAFAGKVDTAKRPEFAKGTFLGTGVVRDGRISTAGICPLAAKELGEPDGTAELTQNFIDSLAEVG